VQQCPAGLGNRLRVERDVKDAPKRAAKMRRSICGPVMRNKNAKLVREEAVPSVAPQKIEEYGRLFNNIINSRRMEIINIKIGKFCYTFRKNTG
jgi:hypothetical protein